jgi:hypothetical protein
VKALAVCDVVDDEPSGGFWINHVTDKIFPLPLDNATIERCAKAAMEAFCAINGASDFWDRMDGVTRSFWRTAIRAAMQALVEDQP